MELELPSLYLETSVISYLAARPSRNVLIAWHQRITHRWWIQQRGKFQLFVSRSVLKEIAAGDPRAADARLAIVAAIPRLDVDQRALSLAKRLVAAHALPQKASEDAAHLAVAAVQKMDYLLTWNCRHLANAETREAIQSTCLLAGYKAPIICTPEQLMGE